ncbi:MAG TPA: RNA polymerase sigma-70 factor [Gemmatimonadaceae bacterium]|nr:RNA polymerase sigma-70 factor [Gemmatimonadaceae bacterium]
MTHAGPAGEEVRGSVFEPHRPLLFSLAYRMLGSVADAEDVVQEAYLRWHRASPEEVASPRDYLCTIVTRLCIDHLRSARVRREEYVGPWLPEPLVAPLDEGPLEAAVLAESLSTAFLLLLERLGEVERVVFLLREVFAFDYPEVARIVGRSEAACRQIVKRARDRIASGTPRFHASPEEAERLTRSFVDACARGNLDDLLALLDVDAVAWTDGGGKVLAARNVIRGGERVARFFAGIAAKWAGARVEYTRVNGQPGLVVTPADGLPRVITLAIDAGRVAGVFLVANPEKLRGVGAGRSQGP